MLQAWILRGIAMASPASEYTDGQIELGRLFVDAGYSSVVATNCEQEYLRYLRPGDRVVAETVFESISEREGHRTRHRVLHRHPHHLPRPARRGSRMDEVPHPALQAQPAGFASKRPRAPRRTTRRRAGCGRRSVTTTNGGGTASHAGELRIQRCKECQTLRHPPRPMCGKCQSIEWDWADLEGRRHASTRSS